MSDKVATLIGATFGLVYVVVNAEPLPGPLPVVLCAAAVLTYVGVLVMLSRVSVRRTADDSGARGFGRGYWLVVAGEIAAYAVGIVFIRAFLDVPRAPLAWITCVVGVHFFGLAAVWSMSFFRWLGAAITVCGALGLVLAAVRADDAAIAVVAGIVPGVVLLSASFRIGVRASIDTRQPI